MHEPLYPRMSLQYAGPRSLPALLLSAVGEERRDHVIARLSRQDRLVFAIGLVAEFILDGALRIRGDHVEVLDGAAIERLAAPCGRSVRATLSRNLTIDEALAEIEGPARTVAWTALQRERAAHRYLLRGWVLDPDATFYWHHMLASAHQNPDTINDRAAALWTILAESGLHRDQLRTPGLQPLSACPDALHALLLPRHQRHRRTRFRRHQHH
ncbi:hypothetical protein [Amycolatopsis sp. lyj-112]|uniref:hypothetical protein n=1 Tax=Amycolatopsis sp. lyj-112 TaxID=2789288 RepID=UPI00397E8CAE